MFSEIITQIRTSEDKYLSMLEIDLLLNSLYKSGDKSFEATMAKHIRASFADILERLVKKEGVDKTELLQELRSQILALKEIVLEIAFDPSSEAVNKIYDWLSDHTKEVFVITFSVNYDIIGGAVISNEGKFYNGSIRDEVAKSINQQNEK